MRPLILHDHGNVGEASVEVWILDEIGWCEAERVGRVCREALVVVHVGDFDVGVVG
jgi:hypothetical protein